MSDPSGPSPSVDLLVSVGGSRGCVVEKLLKFEFVEEEIRVIAALVLPFFVNCLALYEDLLRCCIYASCSSSVLLCSNAKAFSKRRSGKVQVPSARRICVFRYVKPNW